MLATLGLASASCRLRELRHPKASLLIGRTRTRRTRQIRRKRKDREVIMNENPSAKIEALLREAAEVPLFKELLLAERSRAAARIGMVLDVPEAAILDSVAEEQLIAMIEKTPRGDRMNYEIDRFVRLASDPKIDVLLRKAKEDPQFRELLLAERSRACATNRRNAQHSGDHTARFRLREAAEGDDREVA